MPPWSIVIDGDPVREITLLQHPQRFDMVMKGGAVVDTTTEIPDRRIWFLFRSGA
jgi:hypothetical protein